MKTILAPIDFSEVSENTAHYAAELAKFSNARLLLLSTYSLPILYTESPIPDMQYDEIDKINRMQLKALEKNLKSQYGNIETEVITAIGPNVEEILSCAEVKKADVIVMGVGKNGVSSSIIGGNRTPNIIGGSTQPVLAIPEGVKFKKPARIALACDYNSIIPDDVVEKFISFIELFQSKVLVFDVLKSTELISYEKAVAEQSLEESLRTVDHTIHFPSGSDLVEEINSFVDKHVVDMLVMIPHKYNFLTGLFHKSNTKQMAMHSHIPLLTIHE